MKILDTKGGYIGTAKRYNEPEENNKIPAPGQYDPIEPSPKMHKRGVSIGKANISDSDRNDYVPFGDFGVIRKSKMRF